MYIYVYAYFLYKMYHILGWRPAPFGVSSHNPRGRVQIEGDVLFARARVHCDSKPFQTGLNAIFKFNPWIV